MELQRISDVRVLTMSLTQVVGIDTVTEITYDQGQFFSSFHVVGGPAGQRKELGADELKALLATLKEAQHHKGTGLDATALAAFIHLLSQAIQSEPSTFFDHARFGDVARDAGKAIVAHLGLGIDMVGTIHDAKGSVTVETHVVPMKPGAFHPLSAPDRASLIKALKAFVASAHPRANPLWDELLHDLAK